MGSKVKVTDAWLIGIASGYSSINELRIKSPRVYNELKNRGLLSEALDIINNNKEGNTSCHS